MLGKTFRVTAPAPAVAFWRTVALPIPGARPMTVALSSDRRGCAALAAAMLGMDEDELGVDMIDDFMRELLNMTAGQIKVELSLDQALGLPRIHDGDALFEHFTRTRAIRKGIVQIGQDSASPDFGRPHPDLPHEPLPKPYASEKD